LTAAVPGQHGKFLINPFGLLFEEITASSLITIDFDGNIIDQGTTDYDINKPGLVLHSAVHAVRKIGSSNTLRNSPYYCNRRGRTLKS